MFMKIRRCNEILYLLFYRRKHSYAIEKPTLQRVGNPIARKKKGNSTNNISISLKAPLCKQQKRPPSANGSLSELVDRDKFSELHPNLCRKGGSCRPSGTLLILNHGLVHCLYCIAESTFMQHKNRYPRKSSGSMPSRFSACALGR